MTLRRYSGVGITESDSLAGTVASPFSQDEVARAEHGLAVAFERTLERIAGGLP